MRGERDVEEARVGGGKRENERTKDKRQSKRKKARLTRLTVRTQNEKHIFFLMK